MLPSTFCNHFVRATQKTKSFVKEGCLLIRYLAMAVLWLRAFVSTECVYRVIA
jgi:hypothetical protein